MTIAELLKEASTHLRPREGMHFPAREARTALARLLGTSETFILSHPETEVPPQVCQDFRSFLLRRAHGEPFHLIFGDCPFFGREFVVRPGVLIPRPETELLVEEALRLPLPPSPRIVDVGTGSGCLAVTLAIAWPSAKVVATDLAREAVALAQENARRFGAKVHFCQGDLGRHLHGPFHLVVANLPYLPDAYQENAPPELAFEPPEALYAGAEGLSYLERFLPDLSRLLAFPGFGLLELGPGQAQRLLPSLPGDLESLQIIRDAGGYDRVWVLKKRPPLALGARQSEN